MSEKSEHKAVIAEEKAAESREVERLAEELAYNAGIEAAAVALEAAYGWNAMPHAKLIRALKR